MVLHRAAATRCAAARTVTLSAVQETQTHAVAEDIPLDILYEDEHVFVLDKPAGLVVHPGAGNPAGTLVNALLHRDPTLELLPRAGIVHRLDKDTSGVMVVARTCRRTPRWSRSCPRARSIGSTWPSWSARWSPAAPPVPASTATRATACAWRCARTARTR
jgi:hypothetical protein